MSRRPNDDPPLQLTVNGRPMTVQARTLAALLHRLDLKDAAVVAEVNGHIVLRENFAHSPLKEGDKIELVRFVGGG